MKYLTYYAIMIVAIITAGSCSCQKSNVDTRDYDYEAYCDSIWKANPTYYLDVLIESDEYQEYIEVNGEWWGS